jgi:hypothetical protein
MIRRSSMESIAIVPRCKISPSAIKASVPVSISSRLYSLRIP